MPSDRAVRRSVMARDRLERDINARDASDEWRALDPRVQDRWVGFIERGFGPWSRRVRRRDVVDALIDGVLEHSNPYAGGAPIGSISDAIDNLFE